MYHSIFTFRTMQSNNKAEQSQQTDYKPPTNTPPAPQSTTGNPQLLFQLLDGCKANERQSEYYPLLDTPPRSQSSQSQPIFKLFTACCGGISTTPAQPRQNTAKQSQQTDYKPPVNTPPAPQSTTGTQGNIRQSHKSKCYRFFKGIGKRNISYLQLYTSIKVLKK